jgi:hypothetical protein
MIQFLLVLAIGAIILGLGIIAVQKSRELQARTQSFNNLKMMTLATQNCSESNKGKLPPVVGSYPTSANRIEWDALYMPPHFGTLYCWLVPYLEQDCAYMNFYMEMSDSGKGPARSFRSPVVFKFFQAPSDPSLPPNRRTWGDRGATSYAANWHVFRGGWDEDWQVGGVHSIPGDVPDGLGNTIFFAERYAVCGQFGLTPGVQYVEHIWGEDGQSAGPRGEVWNVNANFAPGFWEHLPGSGTGDQDSHSAQWHKVPNYPWSYARLPQFKPPITQCDPWRVQGFSAQGILVGLGDGSVRMVSPNMSQTTWGCAVDPRDGMTLGTDW